MVCWESHPNDMSLNQLPYHYVIITNTFRSSIITHSWQCAHMWIVVLILLWSFDRLNWGCFCGINQWKLGVFGLGHIFLFMSKKVYWESVLPSNLIQMCSVGSRRLIVMITLGRISSNNADMSSMAMSYKSSMDGVLIYRDRISRSFPYVRSQM